MGLGTWTFAAHLGGTHIDEGADMAPQPEGGP